jgi:hypothetical protein
VRAAARLPRAAPHPSWEDRFSEWLGDRIFNDRELDHGLLMVVLGVWLGFFRGELGATAWWAEVFSVLPAGVWAVLLISLGAARIILARFERGPKLAGAAFASCLLLSFLAFLVMLVRWRMTVTPILWWLAYQAMKSHLRIMLNRRRKAGA